MKAEVERRLVSAEHLIVVARIEDELFVACATCKWSEGPFRDGEAGIAAHACFARTRIIDYITGLHGAECAACGWVSGGQPTRSGSRGLAALHALDGRLADCGTLMRTNDQGGP